MAKLTDEQKRAYVQNGGNRCPFCTSYEIEGTGQVQTDAGYAWQPIKCLSCDEHWNDVYKLVDVDQE
jgi:hypothetical protein